MAVYCVTAKVLTATTSGRPFHIPTGLRQGFEKRAAQFGIALHSSLHVAVEQGNTITYKSKSNQFVRSPMTCS
jgi:hypothetical protein